MERKDPPFVARKRGREEFESNMSHNAPPPPNFQRDHFHQRNWNGHNPSPRYPPHFRERRGRGGYNNRNYYPPRRNDFSRNNGFGRGRGRNRGKSHFYRNPKRRKIQTEEDNFRHLKKLVMQIGDKGPLENLSSHVEDLSQIIGGEDGLIGNKILHVIIEAVLMYPPKSWIYANMVSVLLMKKKEDQESDIHEILESLGKMLIQTYEAHDKVRVKVILRFFMNLVVLKVIEKHEILGFLDYHCSCLFSRNDFIEKENDCWMLASLLPWISRMFFPQKELELDLDNEGERDQHEAELFCLNKYMSLVNQIINEKRQLLLHQNDINTSSSSSSCYLSQEIEKMNIKDLHLQEIYLHDKSILFFPCTREPHHLLVFKQFLDQKKEQKETRNEESSSDDILNNNNDDDEKLELQKEEEEKGKENADKKEESSNELKDELRKHLLHKEIDERLLKQRLVLQTTSRPIKNDLNEFIMKDFICEILFLHSSVNDGVVHCFHQLNRFRDSAVTPPPSLPSSVKNNDNGAEVQANNDHHQDGEKRKNRNGDMITPAGLYLRKLTATHLISFIFKVPFPPSKVVFYQGILSKILQKDPPSRKLVSESLVRRSKEFIEKYEQTKGEAGREEYFDIGEFFLLVSTLSMLSQQCEVWWKGRRRITNGGFGEQQQQRDKNGEESEGEEGFFKHLLKVLPQYPLRRLFVKFLLMDVIRLGGFERVKNEIIEEGFDKEIYPPSTSFHFDQTPRVNDIFGFVKNEETFEQFKDEEKKEKKIHESESEEEEEEEEEENRKKRSKIKSGTKGIFEEELELLISCILYECVNSSVNEVSQQMMKWKTLLGKKPNVTLNGIFNFWRYSMSHYEIIFSMSLNRQIFTMNDFLTFALGNERIVSDPIVIANILMNVVLVNVDNARERFIHSKKEEEKERLIQSLDSTYSVLSKFLRRKKITHHEDDGNEEEKGKDEDEEKDDEDEDDEEKNQEENENSKFCRTILKSFLHLFKIRYHKYFKVFNIPLKGECNFDYFDGFTNIRDEKEVCFSSN